MSWTAFKKHLRVGARIRILNLRRPWRSRDAEIVTKTKRHIVVKDDDGKLANIPLPAASFTRMREDGFAEILAEEDGPRFHKDTREPWGEIPAGMPFMAIGLLEEAP